MKQPIRDIQCRLRLYRQRMDWSQEELAAKVGLRRQAVYDMESGKYLPNTAVALRLAALFSCRVEDLFAPAEAFSPQPARMATGSATKGDRVVLGKVRASLVAVPLPAGVPRAADGRVIESRGDHILVEQCTSPELTAQSLIIMGCDPALELLGDHLRRLLPLVLTHTVFASSAQALRALAAGNAHAAAVHFYNDGEGEANVLAAEAALAGMPCRMQAFSSNEEGLMTVRGNPKGIRGVEDLARPDLRFVNREPGAALRRLLQAKLAENGIPENVVRRGQGEVHSHAEGALRVLSGEADVALGVRLVARSYGLHFVPLAVTRCDLVIPSDLATHPTAAALSDILQSSRLRRDMEALPGYDGAVTGRETACIHMHDKGVPQ